MKLFLEVKFSARVVQGPLLPTLLSSNEMLELPEPPVVIHSIVLCPAVNVAPSVGVVNHILRAFC